jgi:hypothetical protein
MKWLPVLLMGLVSGAYAQDGPSLAETTTYLVQKLNSDSGRASWINPKPMTVFTASTTKVSADKCILQYTYSSSLIGSFDLNPPIYSRDVVQYTATVDLQHVSVDSIHAVEDRSWITTVEFEVNPPIMVNKETTSTLGPASEQPAKTKSSVDKLSTLELPARDRDTAQRLVNALYHAALLCGAKADPFSIR